jgi:hypothetical protein
MRQIIGNDAEHRDGNDNEGPAALALTLACLEKIIQDYQRNAAMHNGRRTQRKTYHTTV